MSVIGVIPFVHPDRRSVDVQRQLGAALLALRMALRAKFAPDEPITCTITSQFDGEGKTFVALNMCVHFADAGFRTLLLDGDRHGAGERAVGKTEIPHVGSHAREPHGIGAFVYPTMHERLFVMSGRAASTGAARTGSDRRGTVMDALRAQFDVVVLDCPWWGRNANLDELARQTGGYLVVRRDDASSGPRTLPTVAGQTPPPAAHLGDILIAAR